MDELLFQIFVGVLIWPFYELKNYKQGNVMPKSVAKFLFLSFISLLFILLIIGIVFYLIGNNFFVWGVILITVSSSILGIYLILLLFFLVSNKLKNR